MFLDSYSDISRLDLTVSPCSHHLDHATFLALITQAAQQARRNLRLVEMRSQAADHPIQSVSLETDYLKYVILLNN